jgi:myo-inositol 2-dehydrogenase / D-chiro-inositol 1-dehydrogenase
VSWLYHAPALEHLERLGLVSVVGIFDPDDAAVTRMARRFPKAVRMTSALDLTGARLAIIASPPACHATQTIHALRAGVAVLCEKPLAASIADARAMIAAQQETGGVLAVNFVRRWLPAVHTVRSVLRANLLGAVRRVSCFEGGPFRWPARSAFFFQQSGGGGVLADIGVHVFDLLVSWFGMPSDLEYEDDAIGGVEANCRFRLSYDSDLEIMGRLSRDWELPNAYDFECSRGRMRWTVADADRVEVRLLNSDELLVLASRHIEHSVHGQVFPSSFERCFVHQIVNVIDGADGTASLVAPADDGLTAMRLIAQCYTERRPMRMEWLSDVERRNLPMPAALGS